MYVTKLNQIPFCGWLPFSPEELRMLGMEKSKQTHKSKIKRPEAAPLAKKGKQMKHPLKNKKKEKNEQQAP
jgi:hypothetical protein